MGTLKVLHFGSPRSASSARSLRVTNPKSLLLAIAAFTTMTAGCQTKPAPAASAASTTPAAAGTTSAIALQPYTAPDQSASAGVPAGWQVTSGNQTVIKMTGPQGVSLSLGVT